MNDRRHSRIALVVALASTLTLGGCTTVSTLISAVELNNQPTPTPTVASHPPTGLIALTVGDCVNRAALEDGDASTDPLVACDTPHDLEVFASLTVADGAYPSVEALSNQGTHECSDAFDTFVGLDFELSDLDFVFYYPTESSWANGDRGIDCLIGDPAGRTTGTLSGAAR